jgi:hypothetical protein
MLVLMRAFVSFFVLAALLIQGPAFAYDPPPFGPHVMYGIVRRVEAATVVVQRHNGKLESVDIRAARSAGRTGVLYAGRAVALYGDFDRAHRYHVNAIVSTYELKRGVWPADR